MLKDKVTIHHRGFVRGFGEVNTRWSLVPGRRFEELVGSELRDLLKEFATLRVLHVETVEQQEGFSFGGDAVKAAEIVDEVLEPSREKASDLKIAEVGMGLMGVFKVLAYALVGQRVACLCVAFGLALTETDVEEWGKLAKLNDHARFASATGLDDGGASEIRRILVGWLVLLVKFGDKAEKAKLGIASILATKLG